MRTFLITSGAYISPEMEAEFGQLPPAFLPIGNRRLFVHQYELVRGAADRLLMSIPEDFAIDPADESILDRMQIERVRVPTGLTLGQSVVYAINITASAGDRLRIIHGDTLLLGLNLDVDDAISVESAAEPGYRWGYAPDARSGDSDILTGFFGFSSAGRFVQSVTRCNGDFVAALSDYQKQAPLTRVVADTWLDCGHLNTYHRSRLRMTTERAFNRLDADRRRVTKSSANQDKIKAESAWFENLPAALRMFVPAYLGQENSPLGTAYGLEYLYLPTLSDLYVFGRPGSDAWQHIFDACAEFLSACSRHAAPLAVRDGPDLYRDKSVARLERFARETGTPIDRPSKIDGRPLPSLLEIVEMCASRIPASNRQTIVHGDFCFSNIFYDARSEAIRVIDPRGMDQSNNVTIHGDIRYDIGKLHHSAVGGYDGILAANYRLIRNGTLDFDLRLDLSESQLAVGGLFRNMEFAGVRVDSSIDAISVLLFLSMLPLHADDPDRQMALLANGLRLFAAMDGARSNG